MTIALIITTYNRPDALTVCLDSAMRQSRMPDEIVVCDDGSRPDTADVAAGFAAVSPVPLRHVWQEDRGFRLAASRNRGLATVTSDYIIQIDGDIMMHPDFVADHEAVARKGWFVKGARVRLGREFTESVCAGRKAVVVPLWSKGILKDREKALRLGRIGRMLSHRYKVDTTSGIGCNMSYWREDIMRVNGYDENYVGWGCEDDDLCLRFAKAGIHNFKLYRIGLAYHLWHRGEENADIDKSLSYLRRRAADTSCRCERGIDQYLSDTDNHQDN